MSTLDYGKAKVFMITDRRETEEHPYIGATTLTLQQALRANKKFYSRWLKDDASIKFMPTFYLYDKYGRDGVKIKWIANIPCSTPKEFFNKRKEYVDNL